MVTVAGESTPDPLRLQGLRQALYVFNELEKGKQDIITEFEGDEKLVNMWLSFLLSSHWIEQDKQGRFVVTEKGLQWAKRVQAEIEVA